MNKRLLLALAAGCMISNTSYTMELKDLAVPAAKLVGLGLAAASMEYGLRTKFAYNLFTKIGVSPIGASQVGRVMTGAYTLGLLTTGNPALSNACFHLGHTAPFMGLANAVLKHDIIRNALSKIPVLGSSLTCPLATDEQVDSMKAQMAKNGIDASEINAIKKCKRTCEHCNGIDAIRLISGWVILRYGAPIAWDSIQNYLKK